CLKGYTVLYNSWRLLSGFILLLFRALRMHSTFSFNDTSTTELYPLSLHDALPICSLSCFRTAISRSCRFARRSWGPRSASTTARSEEHTSELQSRRDLVCRLLLEKKKKILDKGKQYNKK